MLNTKKNNPQKIWRLFFCPYFCAVLLRSYIITAHQNKFLLFNLLNIQIMKKIFFLFAILFVATLGTVKAQDAAMVTEIKKSIELQHTRDIMVETMSLQYKTLVDNGTLAIDNVQAMSEEIADVIMGNITDKLIKFYTDNYTLDELKELNKFLTTPVGQKNIKLAPQAALLGTQAVQDPDVLSKMQAIVMKHLNK